MEFSVGGNVPGSHGASGDPPGAGGEGGDVTQPSTIGRDSWRLRSVQQDLADRYRAEGWWTDATLGQMVADGLGSMGQVGFRVRSAVRPWEGTFADVDRAARSLATELRARGVGPGSLVVFQLPNWVEAGIAFWATAYLGAVVVPIVHFYGAKEVGYIVRATEPDVVVTAGRFGHSDHLAVWEEVLAQHPVPLWLVVGDTPTRDLPATATPFASLLDAGPLAGPVAADPDGPAIVGFTSGTTRDPKAVVHSHHTIGCETRQLDYFFPAGGPPQITGAPVGHFIGMLNACWGSTASPRSASSPPPTCASASVRPPSCACVPGRRHRRSTPCATTWRPPARPARSGPGRCTSWTSSRAPRRGRCRRFRLRHQLREGRLGAVT
jgi:hypothetical protein